jgi:hypothetical protein
MGLVLGHAVLLGDLTFSLATSGNQFCDPRQVA